MVKKTKQKKEKRKKGDTLKSNISFLITICMFQYKQNMVDSSY